MADQTTTIDQTQTQTLQTPGVDQTQPAAGSQTTSNTQTQAPSEPTPDDILTKVTAKPTPKAPQDIAGTFKEFDDVTDPVLKQKLIDRAKSLQADYTKKTQALSVERQDLQKQLKDMENWTPEKVQNYLLKNPSFLQAAQVVASQPQNPAGSGLTDEQYSALTTTEKNQLLEMNRQIGELRQQNFTSAMGQKDALLQTKYGDYDALRVNEGIQNLSRINPIDIREHVYKAIYHDDHVQAAYEMGRKEGQGLNTQRTQAVAASNGVVTMPASDIPKKDKNETDVNYFARLAQRRIDQSKQTTGLRK